MTHKKALLICAWLSTLFLLWCGSWRKNPTDKMIDTAEDSLEAWIEELDDAAEDLIDEAEELLEEEEKKEENNDDTNDKKEEEEEKVILEKELPEAPSEKGDRADYESIIWWSRYATKWNSTSLFTFRWDNTFMLNVWGKDAQGEWTVEDGQILVWDEELKLNIISENEIEINWVTYKRNENDWV